MCPRVVAVSKSPSCGWRYCSRYISGSIGQKASVPYMSIWGGRVSMQCCQTSSCQSFGGPKERSTLKSQSAGSLPKTPVVTLSTATPSSCQGHPTCARWPLNPGAWRTASKTKLDSEIGDGDHGNNMHRGFQAALERL